MDNDLTGMEEELESSMDNDLTGLDVGLILFFALLFFLGSELANAVNRVVNCVVRRGKHHV